jgi:hypothetical protein
MTRHYSVFTLVLCMALFGCGGGSYGNGGGNPPAFGVMQAGQWEFVATPTNAPPVFVETNLIVSGTSVSATQPNVELFEPNGSTFSACTNFTISASMANGVLAGTMTGVGSGVQTTFSGATVASGGISVSGGSYTSPNLCGLAANQSSGTFTGNAIAPLNGTFSGTITGSGQTQQVAIHVTQDSNFGLTVTGTSVQSGVTSTISISPNSNLPFNTDIRGAFVYANGTATNVNGTSPFQVLAHINPTATQITIIDQSGVQSGTLTKQ